MSIEQAEAGLVCPDMSKPNCNPIDQIRSQHRMLAILRALLRAPAYRSNIEVIESWLDRLALSSGNEIHSIELRRLAELGFCELENVDGLICMTLTRDGADVANGIVFCGEVARPGPECRY